MAILIILPRILPGTAAGNPEVSPLGLIKSHEGEIDRRQIGFDGPTDRRGDLGNARIAAAPLPSHATPICRAAIAGGPRVLTITAVIPGRAKHEPGIHTHDRGYGFRPARSGASRNDEEKNRAQSTKLADGQITSDLRKSCQAQNKKYFAFPECEQGISMPIPSRSEGRIMIATNVGRAAVDAEAATDERG